MRNIVLALPLKFLNASYVHVCLYAIHVGGESGSADTVRDPRGFAVKFYTEDGNWDLVGNNTPIFFIRDPILVGCVYTLCKPSALIRAV